MTAARLTGRVRAIEDDAPPARTSRGTKTGFVRSPVQRGIKLERQRPAGHPLPIWLAALVAAR